MTDNTSNNANANDGSSIVQPLYMNTNNSEDDALLLMGYACQNVLQSNQVMDLEQTFYMDLLTAKGTQQLAIAEIQQRLVEAIATRYQISSGVRCVDLPVDGSTWIVEFHITPDDFVVNDTFGGCRSDNMKAIMSDDENNTSSVFDCNFYQVQLKGSYVGTTEQFQDLVAFLERTLNSDTLTDDLNEQTPAMPGQPDFFQTAFQGVPVIEDGGDFLGTTDEGRENLNEPTNVEEVVTQAPNGADRTTITIVGGLLVAAFGVAFLLVGYMLWRRRRAYVQSRDYQLDNGSNYGNGNGMDKLSVAGEGADTEGGPDLEPYNTSNTDDLDDDFENEHGAMNVNSNVGFGVSANNNNNNNTSQANMSHDLSVYLKDDVDDVENNNNADANVLNRSNLDTIDGGNDEELPSPTADGSTMQFDLGNSFKDQLMGLHGSKNGGGGGNPSKKNGMMMLPGSLFSSNKQEPSLDGDSDADSWAQTDGTIGSLELQLEPITAEV